MLLIQNYDTIIFERYGYNKITKEISDEIIKLIDQNIGRLILNGSISLKSLIPTSCGISFINDEINIKLTNRFYGNINLNSLIINNNSIKNLVLNLELELSPSEISARKLIDNNISGTIEHELLHTIEKYLTISDGRNIANSFSMDAELKKIDKKYTNSQNWQDISYLIYLSFPHEIRSRIQQLNREIENTHIRGIENINSYIKNTKIYQDLDFLTKINPIKILNNLKNDKYYKDILKDFSIYVLKNNNINYENNFFDYIKKMKQKNKKMIDKLERTSYNFENINQDKILKYKYFL
jgi:hypothetical protein